MPLQLITAVLERILNSASVHLLTFLSDPSFSGKVVREEALGKELEKVLEREKDLGEEVWLLE